MMLNSMPPANPNRSGDKRNEGFFLVGVLVFCFILIPVIATFAQTSRTAASATDAANEGYKIEFLAAGLTEAFASRLGTDRNFLRQFADYDSISCQFQNLAIRFRLQDHDGKIDLNDASSALLIAGFKAAGVSDQQAQILQQFVEASRSNNSLAPEAAEALSSLASLKHAPFERVEEVNDAIEALKLAPIDLQPFFTIYRRAGDVEYNTAAKSLRDIIDATPQIKDQVSPDNGSFSYLDIVVDAARPNGIRYALLKTYVRLTEQGDVREVASKVLHGDPTEPSAREYRTEFCGSLLGLEGDATAHV